VSQRAVEIPSSLREIIQDFRGCFTKPGAENFARLIVGWMLCQTRTCISRVIQASGGIEVGAHFSKFYRFLSEGRWRVDDLGHVLFQLLLRFAPGRDLTLIIDDTLCHKSGPHIFGGAMHYDSHKSTYGRGTSAGKKGFFAFGQNWVVAALWIPCPWDLTRGIAVPFVFRLYRSQKRCSTKAYRKRTELANDLIELVLSWLPEGRTLHVLGDAEYACGTIVRRLSESTEFTGPMNMKAALFALPGPKRPGRGRPAKRGRRLLSPAQLAKAKSTPWTKSTIEVYGKTVVVLTKSVDCLWYTVAHTRPVRMVITRDPKGRLGDRAYFTTAVGLSIEEVLAQYARRWEIEVSFRNTKQHLGLENPQNGWWRRPSGTRRPKKKPGPNAHERIGQQATEHTLAMTFAAHAIVILWYWQHGKPDVDVATVHKSAPWYRTKKAPSFADMLTAVRLKMWEQRIPSTLPDDRNRKKRASLVPRWLLAA